MTNIKRFPTLEIGDLIIKKPIIQGGMGVGISLSNLASAVSNAGGIGVISAAGLGFSTDSKKENSLDSSNRALKEEIMKVRKKTKGIFGVNIMVALSNFSELVKVCVKEHVDIIFAGAGLPLDLPKYLESKSKTKLIPIISSAKAAKVILKRWLEKFDYIADGFVVEGPLAGGHLGFSKEQLNDKKFTLEVILKEVLEVVKGFEDKYKKKIPVIAAGGIFTGQDIYKYLKIGASGVQLGTRFVATNECDASEVFKQTLVNAKEDDLTIVNSPVGLLGRVVKNGFVDSVELGNQKPLNCPYRCIKTCQHKNSPYCIALALLNAKNGSQKEGLFFAGANAHRLESITSVDTLMNSLEEEYLTVEKSK